MDDKVKQALNDLLSPVDMHRIVTSEKVGSGVKLRIGGEPVSREQLLNLKSEAEFLTASSLWGLLYETPKAHAEKAIFVNGESLDDLKKGRAILYTLSIQKNILDTFKNIDTGK